MHIGALACSQMHSCWSSGPR